MTPESTYHAVCPVCEAAPADVSWQTATNQEVCGDAACPVNTWDPTAEPQWPGGRRIGSEDGTVSLRFIPCAQVPKWSFENTAVREWVEYHLDGRVLNACAGKSRLRHDGEIVRNDIDEDIDADLHVDIADLADHLEPGSFDRVVFDPPFSVYQSNLRYDGRQVGHAKVAKEGFHELLAPGGKVIELGYHGSCMPSRLGYERIERAWFCTVGRHKDVLGSVDVKAQTMLGGT